MRRQRDVFDCVDVIYVRRLPFAVSISHVLKFGTVEALMDCKAKTLLVSLKHIKATYARRGFLFSRVTADNEFGTLEIRISDEVIVRQWRS